MAPKTEASESRNVYSSLGSGAGIGVLVGTLIGLSLSPVVGAFLGGLTALLAAFLGLSDERLPGSPVSATEGREQVRRARDLRACAFGIACTLGVLLGITLRAQNLLGVSLEKQYEAWKRVGFSDEEARDLMRYKELGLVPEGMAQNAPQSGSANRPDVTALYANPIELCRSLEPDRFSGPTETLRAWSLRTEGHWQEIANQIRYSVPEDRQADFLETTWRLACD